MILISDPEFSGKKQLSQWAMQSKAEIEGKWVNIKMQTNN
jgi:hypothetical protein